METRKASWGKLLTPGPLLIHAAKRWTVEEEDLCGSEPFGNALASCNVVHPPCVVTDGQTRMPFGAVIGCVNVRAVISTDRVKWQPGEKRFFSYDQFAHQLVISDTEKAFGDYSDGRVAVILDKPQAFRVPVPYTGRQSLFDVPDAMVQTALAFAVGQHHIDHPAGQAPPAG